jgi:transposase InsO family protein
MPPSHAAAGPNQIRSLYITSLSTQLGGTFCWRLLILAIRSRKVVGWRIATTNNSAYATALFHPTCAAAAIDQAGIL